MSLSLSLYIYIYIYVYKHTSGEFMCYYIQLFTLLNVCVSSSRRGHGHANLLSIVPILTDDPRRESDMPLSFKPEVTVVEF